MYVAGTINKRASYRKGFGRQYEHKRGNFLELGQDQTWIMRQDSTLDDLVLFWDKIAAVGCSVSAPIVAHAALMQSASSTGSVTNQTAYVQAIAGTGAGTYTGRSGYPGGGFPAFFPLTSPKSLFHLGQGTLILLRYFSLCPNSFTFQMCFQVVDVY